MPTENGQKSPPNIDRLMHTEEEKVKNSSWSYKKVY